jgi:hypothetical protein
MVIFCVLAKAPPNRLLKIRPLLKRDGWREIPGTLNGILKQANLKNE